MLKSGPLDNASGDAPMTRRRLRLPALIALFAVAAPVLASQTDAAPRDDARHMSAMIRHSSSVFGRRVAHGAREAGHQFNAGLHQVGHNVHRWWGGVRSSVARA